MPPRPDLSQIYLAVDRDSAGENLARELSRRLGRQKCKVTQWPEDWRDHACHLGSEEAARRHDEHVQARCLEHVQALASCCHELLDAGSAESAHGRRRC
jgi:DNA primase